MIRKKNCLSLEILESGATREKEGHRRSREKVNSFKGAKRLLSLICFNQKPRTLKFKESTWPSSLTSVLKKHEEWAKMTASF